MTKRFRESTLDQMYLLPPSLQEWLPEGHLARFVAELCEELKLDKFLARHEERDGRGQAAYTSRGTPTAPSPQPANAPTTTTGPASHS